MENIGSGTISNENLAIYTQIAKTCHEANRAYCETLGDYSQPKWEDAPEWQKESAIGGVVFHYNNDNTSPRDSHNSWLAAKAADGWKYGEVKDPEKKEHPCFVPYEELPQHQQLKDYIFKAIVDGYKDFYKTPKYGGVKKENDRPLTDGEKLVGLSFNPSGREDVNKAKQLSADLIDLVQANYNEVTDNGNKMASWYRNVLRIAAVTSVIAAQQAVVKILTWNE